MYNKYDLAPSNGFKPVPPTVITAFPRSAWVHPKQLKRQLKKRGAYHDVMVLMKGAQLMMSASPVAAEAEQQMRKDDARVNKSDEVESM
jgi:hypothetical protein